MLIKHVFYFQVWALNIYIAKTVQKHYWVNMKKHFEMKEEKENEFWNDTLINKIGKLISNFQTDLKPNSSSKNTL